MTSNLDRSLDEILSSRPRGGRGGRRGGSGAVSGVRKRPQRAAAVKATAAVAQQSAKTPGKAASAITSGGDHSKIIVSNLPVDVTEKMIKEYFSKVVGPVKSCALSYGPNGQSRGIATIAFHKAGDADRAAASYNGVLVDRRPMKVELVVEPKPVTLADRVGPPNKAVTTQPKPGKGPKPATTPSNAQRGKNTRGRGRGRGRPSGRKPKTAEELDAEMADYWVPTNGGNAQAANDASVVTAAYTAPSGDAMMDDQVL